MTPSSRGKTGGFAGSTRPQHGGDAGGVPSVKNCANTDGIGVVNKKTKTTPKNTVPAKKNNDQSYRSDNPHLASGE